MFTNLNTIVISLNYIIKTVEFTTIIIIIFSIIYFLIILYLTYFIYNSLIKKNKNNKNNFEYLSIIKDWEFIIFKNKLLKFYYSTITILLIFIFKNNGFYYLLEGSVMVNHQSTNTSVIFFI